MDIKRIGQYMQPVTPAPRQQPASGVTGPAAQPVAPQVTPKAPAQAQPAAPRVQARDLLSEDERSYLEMLFPGATAIDTYGGKGKTPAPPTGSIVDRKG